MVSDIALFFEPIGFNLEEYKVDGTLGNTIQCFTQNSFPEIEQGTVAIFSVNEFRGFNGQDNLTGIADSVRKELFQLKDHFGNLKIVDLGNISPGETMRDTYYAVSTVVGELVRQGGVAVIIGGSQDLTYANYLAYEKLEQIVNLVTIDSRFDIGEVEDEVSASKYLQKILLHQPNILFNYSNLAYQTHHVLPKETDLLKKMYFDAYRLGELQDNLDAVEPVVRNADILSFDLSSIRSSDNPQNALKEPNGLYGEEACAIARYAGLSDKLSSIGMYNQIHSDQQSDKLVSQILWYFLLGVCHRKKDYPFADKETYTKYTVALEDGAYDVIFYKSHLSDRWWMEVPYPSTKGAKYERHFMVPCTYQDYKLACNDEIPDRWWQTFQKLG